MNIDDVEVSMMHKIDFKKARKLIMECFPEKDDNKSGEMKTGDFSVIAKYNNEIVGHILIHKIYNPFNDKLSYYLQDICVKEEYRKQGVASKMLDEIKRIGLLKKVESIVVTTNDKKYITRKLYTKNDYDKKDTEIFIKYL